MSTTATPPTLHFISGQPRAGSSAVSVFFRVGWICSSAAASGSVLAWTMVVPPLTR